jgi:hypothetical protein
VLLGSCEPGHRGQRKEPNVAACDDKRVGDSLETTHLHREVIEALRLTLFLGPGRAAAPRDEMPQLEVVARQIVGALGELKVVPALGETAHRDLERSEPPERGEEVGAQAANLFARRIRARTTVLPAAGLRVDRQLAVTFVEPLTKALAAHSCGRPDDRCTRGHVDADYPAVTMGDKTFSSRA